MIKKTLATFMTIATLVTANLKSIQIDRNNLFVPHALGVIKVSHNNNGFSILKDNEIYRVQNCFVDEVIRNITSKQLNYFLGNVRNVMISGGYIELRRVFIHSDIEKISNLGTFTQLSDEESEDIARQLSCSTNYLTVSQLDDGEYVIHAKQRLNGGGPVAAVAGFWFAKGSIYVISYGFSSLVAVAVTAATLNPGAGATAGALTMQALAVPTEAVSNAAGAVFATAFAATPTP